MDKRADVLTSKIVQVSDSHNEDYFCSWLLCEDGSLWLYHGNFRDFRQVHPPHKPSEVLTPYTMDCLRQLNEQAADIIEVLDALESIMTNPDNDFQPTFALEILQKHGRCKQ